MLQATHARTAPDTPIVTAADARRLMADRPSRCDRFDQWFATAAQGESFIYYRGESLAEAKIGNPGLAALAAHLLERSNSRWDVTSVCGHVRSVLEGTGAVRLVTRRELGELAYLAIKR